jgi:hypothetical protein
MKDKYSNFQFGFRENHRTSDSLFILKTLINKYLHKNKKKLYLCFGEPTLEFKSSEGLHSSVLKLALRSFMKILKRVGLIESPCFTPLKLSKTLNVKKPKTMVVQQNTIQVSPFIDFKGDVIQNVTEYKFLGYLCKCNGNLRHSLEELAKKAKSVASYHKTY